MNGNIFVTTAVHLTAYPPEKNLSDPVGLHNQEEAIQKMHRFCHEIYHVPITWITSWGALKKYGKTLSAFCREFGDEIGIMEYGVDTFTVQGCDSSLYQGWITQAGFDRPKEFQSDEPEVRGIKTWNNMSYEEQKRGIGYLKQAFEEDLAIEMKTFASPFINGDTIRVLKELGFTCIWGYNWNYYCEGINNKGCLPHPFYPGCVNHNIPAAKGDIGPLAVHWGVNVPTVLNVDIMSRRSPAWCTNPMELANRSLGLDQYGFVEAAIGGLIEQAGRNPFVHIPLQLEAMWMDEGPELESFYDQYPGFNSRCTEVFYNEIEVSLRHGATPLTLSQFAGWHGDNIGKTSEVLYYGEDPTPELRGNGKDRSYEPVVIYGDEKRQYYFSKSAGFNYIRRYDYERESIVQHGELPFDTEPRVYLKTKNTIRIISGIHIGETGARYEMSGLKFTAFQDDPHYAAVIWEANIPHYVKDEDIQTTGMTGFRTIRDKNALLLLADLKEGENEMTFSSSTPKRYIHCRPAEKIGRRYEVWIENTGEEAGLCSIEVTLEPGLRLGGFWWNGAYYRTPFVFDWSSYDRKTGQFCMSVCYPRILPLLHGLNRLSIELL